MLSTDIQVIEAEAFFTPEQAHVPADGGTPADDAVTFCHVRARVRNHRGQVADGWGAVLLAHEWAFPAAEIDPATKDAVMRGVVTMACRRVQYLDGYAHPIDLFLAFEPELRTINRIVSQEHGLAAEMPYLGVLVCASALDTAIHDAFGKAAGISTYDGYGPDFMTSDLSAYLGGKFAGQYVSDYLRRDYEPTVPIFHTVGWQDALRDADAPAAAHNGSVPRSLEGWIARDGVFCFNVKLRGTDPAWDYQRLLNVYQIGRDAHRTNGHDRIYLSADANERCDTPEYMVALMDRLREQAPQVFDALLFLEQPTGRDLASQGFDMRPLAALKPVIVDESLTGLGDLELALSLGWSGAALNTGKCQSIELLINARAKAAGLPVTVKDLTHPGIALVHSVGLAARINPMMGVEAAARQLYPETSTPEVEVHPSLVNVREGVAHTESLRGSGFGYQVHHIPRPIFVAD